jgi:hypothetical protein
MSTITVTKSSSAYQELTEDTCITLEICTVRSVLPVDATLGIGRSVIYFVDGSSMNVVESVVQLYDLGIG